MIKQFMTTLLTAISACVLLSFPNLTSMAVTKSLIICARSIIPSLFPFMILTNIWISSGCADQLGQVMSKPMKACFHMPGIAATALITGAIGGFPLGAKTISSLYTDRKLTKKQSEHLLFFCSNASPAFILGVIGQTVFQSRSIGAALWAIHLISAIFLGILFRPSQCPVDTLDKNTVKTTLVGGNIASSIAKAGADIIRICTLVVSFTILTSFIDATLPSAIRTSFLHPMVLGLIELAGAASRFHCISPCSAFMILAVLLAWNGACVHLQVLSVTTECGLTMKKYFLGKLAHMLISFLLSFFCAPMIFKETNSTYTLSNIPYVLFAVCTITIFILLAKTPYRKKQSFHI